MKVQSLFAILVIAAATGWSCSDPAEDTDPTSADTGVSVDTGADAILSDTAGDATDDVAGDTGTTPAYTYYRDVKPIIDARCTTCHVPDSIAPFALRTFEEVAELAPLIKASVVTRTMPPWLAGQDCAEYHPDLSLSQDQIDTIAGWVDQGAPAGDPGEEGPALPSPSVGLSRVDLTMDMPEEYTPVLTPDDYRCFAIDWPEETEKYITGFNVIPGNEGIVHHVIAYAAPPAMVDEVVAREAAEEGPGYTCFGSPGVGNQDILSGEDVAWLGSWAPGGTGADLPEGTGLRVRPGSKIILQVHYNVIGNEPQTDRSSIQFRLSDTVEKEAMFLPWADFRWLSNPALMTIPAGEADATHGFSFDVAGIMNRPITIYNASLHMHLLGTKGTLSISRGNGTEECLLDVPRWDFGWQFGYQLTEPRTMYPGDRLTSKCHWDNSASNQPTINGEQRTPQDVTWGDATTDEMCLGIFYVTFGD